MKLALAILMVAACGKSKPPDDCAEFRATIARLAACPSLTTELAGATKQLADLSAVLAQAGGDTSAPPELRESIRETCKSQNAALQALGCPK